MTLNSIQEAITDFKTGKPIVIIDDEGRENEGDIVASAALAVPETLNFMIHKAGGLICAPMPKDYAERLHLPLMTDHNEESHSTAFTISVDAKNGITTGISAFDRAKTANILADNASTAADLARPGHLFPLVAKEGGILRRAGHTEAAVDLCNLSGLPPVALICEVIKEDGEMARADYLAEFSSREGLKIISVKDLINYRYQHEKFIEKVVEVDLPLPQGNFKCIGYNDTISKKPYLAITMGELNETPTLVRVHSSCMTGDIFHSLRCDCGEQLDQAFNMIAKEGKGVLLYIDQEGRGIGIMNKLKAYALQDQGVDTVDANIMLGFAPDLREYGIGAQVLSDLGIKKLRLMTNNPKKIVGLSGYGLEVVEVVPIITKPNEHNKKYLDTKRTRMGHYLGEK